MRVQQVSIEDFRGIPGHFSLDFTTDKSTTAASLVLAGDNGSGKSSIVDAIEFALQATIQGQTASKERLRAAMSRKRPQESSVSVRLDDGSTTSRSISNVDDLVTLSHAIAHASFCVSPFVLRRADILRFIESPDHERQTVFLKYLRASQEQATHQLPQEGASESELVEERLRLKRQRNTLYEFLADQRGCQPSDIPKDPTQFDSYIREHIYLEIPQRKRRRRDMLRGGITIEVKPAVEKAIRDIRSVSKAISDVNRRISQFTPRRLPQKDLVRKTLSGVADDLSQTFVSLSQCRFVDKLDLRIGDMTDVSLAIGVHLTNGVVCTPKQIFSEANLDLLAFLVFLAFLEKSHEFGQAPLLVLDDVFQSVDSTVRLAVLRHLVNRFANWQFVITVHDRLWRNQVCDALRRAGHSFIEREIIRWDFDRGPEILQARSDVGEDLRQALNRGDAVTVCSQAGRLLEAICHQLSWNLPISVTRRKEDKYTLGDLWPGVYKILKKTNLNDVVTEVHGLEHLRNVVGAHYNEWADAVSAAESNRFGTAVLSLLKAVRCEDCWRWIEATSIGAKVWECKCGNRRVAGATNSGTII